VKNEVMLNVVTYVYRHGKFLHNKAYGWKNIEKKEPVELNSIFRIASQTKALTSVGLMLYEKGKFLLDDPVSKYITEFKNPKVQRRLVSFRWITIWVKSLPTAEHRCAWLPD